MWRATWLTHRGLIPSVTSIAEVATQKVGEAGAAVGAATLAQEFTVQVGDEVGAKVHMAKEKLDDASRREGWGGDRSRNVNAIAKKQ